jgi:hypothetical protein
MRHPETMGRELRDGWTIEWSSSRRDTNGVRSTD